eukprot:TRINITY_DN43573_c0_g1_i1.p1 TRINITY_DN43573_c0_g1~~TRINITY_DN43573_c0_g1_i1.p1  ORF type:complete len:220 (+),score=75.18 TRINITY_DN43573_c0_g1_i1:61-720(+)
MPIEAALIGIASTTDVLSEYKVDKYRSVLPQILTMLKRHDTKSSFQYAPEGGHLAANFNYIVEHRILYMAITNKEETLRLPFSLLDKMKDEFKKEFSEGGRYPDIDSLSAARCRQFNKKMSQLCNSQNDKIDAITADMEELKDIMVENCEQLLQRGEKIDTLIDRATELEGESKSFKTGAKKLKREMLWRNIKFVLLAIVLLVIIIVVICAIACGGLPC